MRHFSKIFIMALVIFYHIGAARALESPWQTAGNLQARLVSATDGTGDKTALSAALALRLGSGWHIYWRMAGDGGVAPRFDWSGSENVADTQLAWPAPQRYTVFDMQSFGYEGDVMFPLTVTPRDVGKAVTLALKADIMICKDICVPQPVSVSLTIPAGAAKDGKEAAVIARAVETVPETGDSRVLAIKSVILGPDALVAQIYAQKGIDKTDLFVESGDVSVTAKPEMTPDKKDPRWGLVRIAKPDGVENLAKSLSGHKVTLTLTDGGRAIEKTYPF